MPYAAYPTAQDVADFVGMLANVSVPQGFDFSHYAAEAAREWELYTAYGPFLSTGESEVRLFDPPGPYTTRPIRGGDRKLILRCGLLSIDSVRVGVAADNSPTVLTPNIDYWGAPAQASYKGWPYTILEFATVQWGYARSFEIAGVWGYCLQIPDDAWLAVRNMASGSALHAVREDYSARNVEYEEKDTRWRKSIELLGTLGDNLAAKGRDVRDRYTLRVL